MEIASKNLIKDGFIHHFYGSECEIANVNPEPSKLEGPNQVKALELVKKFMLKFHHRLYRGNVYKKPDEGTLLYFTYSLIFSS